MLKMDKYSQSELTEDKIKQFFEENFDYLRESAGHTISRNLKEQALQQILCYWKKNKDIVEKMTRSEVKLSLPEQKTPNQSIPYTIEGVVDIVSEGNETWLYDLKTHPVERIKDNQSYTKNSLVFTVIFGKTFKVINLIIQQLFLRQFLKICKELLEIMMNLQLLV